MQSITGAWGVVAAGQVLGRLGLAAAVPGEICTHLNGFALYG
jgi:hypothetical protein